MPDDSDPGLGLVLALAFSWAIGLGALAAIYAWWVPGLVDRMIERGVAFPKPTAVMITFSSVINNAWPIAIPLGTALILGLPRRQAGRVGAFLIALETISVTIVLSGMILAYNALNRA